MEQNNILAVVYNQTKEFQQFLEGSYNKLGLLDLKRLPEVQEKFSLMVKEFRKQITDVSREKPFCIVTVHEKENKEVRENQVISFYISDERYFKDHPIREMLENLEESVKTELLYTIENILSKIDEENEIYKNLSAIQELIPLVKDLENIYAENNHEENLQRIFKFSCTEIVNICLSAISLNMAKENNTSLIDAARIHIEKYLEYFEENPSILYNQGEIEEYSRNYHHAFETYKKGIGLISNPEKQSDILLKFESKIAKLTVFLKKDYYPHSPYLLYKIGTEYQLINNYKTALAYYIKARSNTKNTQLRNSIKVKIEESKNAFGDGKYN